MTPPEELHDGGAAVKRLARGLSAFTRASLPGLETAAAAIEPGEEPLAVGARSTGRLQSEAVVVTDRRLLLAGAKEVRSIPRRDILGVRELERRDERAVVRIAGGEELELGGLKPDDFDEALVALLSVDLEPLAEEPSRR
ncbi:MAG TPA: hypothetical protein VN238_20655 [Solirubrobacteraceae bacterium]|nr:hypothetical protein [Solirubrobacteraceae bacterium]